MAAARSDWPAQRTPATTNKHENFELGNEAILLVLAVRLGLRHKRQQYVSHFRRYVIQPENLKRLGQFEHFRDRDRFLHLPTAKCMSQARNHASERRIGCRAANLQNLRFSGDGRELHSNVETAAPEGIPETADLIR